MILLAGTARAADTAEIPGLVRQPLSLAIQRSDGTSALLDGFVVRPEGRGPFPLVLITNGLPRNAADIPKFRPQAYTSPATIFARHGYATVVVLRSAYGRSTGSFREALGPCVARDYVRPAQAGADDIIAALTTLRGEPWVDPGRIVLVGHSMGGFAVLAAAAANPPGVQAAISFAGAVGSARPDEVCEPDRLAAADSVFGRTAHVPTLWIFAGNDHYFAPDLARRLFAAYSENGAPGALFIAPDYGLDGHTMIGSPDETIWWSRVAAFLTPLRLPTNPVVSLPPLPELAAPAPLEDAGKHEFVAYEQSRADEKAFATDLDGHFGVAYGQRTRTDAARAAVKDCERVPRTCAVYAIGNERAPGR